MQNIHWVQVMMPFLFPQRYMGVGKIFKVCTVFTVPPPPKFMAGFGSWIIFPVPNRYYTPNYVKVTLVVSEKKLKNSNVNARQQRLRQRWPWLSLLHFMVHARWTRNEMLYFKKCLSAIKWRNHGTEFNVKMRALKTSL